ncbi:MAG TPA: endolytic transglycosylase MltG [Candidatus Saccharimonadales bacterium]
MNNDIKPVRPPVTSQPQQPAPPVNAAPLVQPQTPLAEQPPMPAASTDDTIVIADAPKPSRKRLLKWIIIGIVSLLVIAAAAISTWYLLALRPVASGDVDKVQIVIKEGSSPVQIGKLLEEKKVIHSQFAFDIYTRLSKSRNNLQAGAFTLSPALSTPQIVDSLVKGSVEEYSVTFYPGATLNTVANTADKTPSHRQVLEKLGFSDDEIDAGLAADYSDLPLFADKPATADLEGYIYGQTYQVAAGSTVEQILRRTFAEYYAQIEKNNLIDGFKQQGLNLYEGITLASIIQREASDATDQKQVAQVFFTRLAMGMMLGSDVTYQYAADKMGVPRDHTLESPYNTRIHTGLPPGPIGSPGITALQAVAGPAAGDYVYFLSGDDHKTYFAHTNAEHEANITKHCTYKCSLP